MYEITDDARSTCVAAILVTLVRTQEVWPSRDRLIDALTELYDGDREWAMAALACEERRGGTNDNQ